ncbi:alpha/beta fold hydrolase [Streptacidiphilus sp. N1-3]|uniref:Alpha/beta fold hydrolase n=1 Tax=Streptacidiphilus alkalitolerans TaxID=3342712 RepID=A0ABV6X1R8_9ACTN
MQLPTQTWGRPDSERSLLLLHGLSSTAGAWWRVASTLAAEGWTVTAPDLRGHGRAPRTVNYDLRAYRNDVLALRPAAPGPWDVVVGHSLGGATTVHAAAADPQWARAVLLLDPVINLADPMRDKMIKEIQADIRRTDPGDYMSGPRPWHQEDAWQRVLANRAVSDYVIESSLRANVPWSFGDLLLSVKAPVRVLGADPARGLAIFTAEEAESLAAGSTPLSFDVVAGAGHSIHRDDPERVIDEVRTLHERGLG